MGGRRGSVSASKDGVTEALCTGCEKTSVLVRCPRCQGDKRHDKQGTYRCPRHGCEVHACACVCIEHMHSHAEHACVYAHLAHPCMSMHVCARAHVHACACCSNRLIQRGGAHTAACRVCCRESSKLPAGTHSLPLYTCSTCHGLLGAKPGGCCVADRQVSNNRVLFEVSNNRVLFEVSNNRVLFERDSNQRASTRVSRHLTG